MRWLLRLFLDADDRRAIDSDLAELYEVRRRRDGDAAARRWLRRQRILYPLHAAAERLRGWPAAAASTIPHLSRDLRYSVRTLARTPALAATIVLTVGIGLGATTGMLSVVRAVLVDPLPYAAAGEIFWIYTDHPPNHFRFSVVDYRAFEADHPAFSEIAAYQTTRMTLSDRGNAERILVKAVTGSYFPLLRQKPIAGRLFEPSDDASGERMAVLSHAYWKRQFAGDPSIAGRTITLDGASYTIAGVLQPADGPLEHDVALFTAARWPPPKRKGPFFVTVLARLRHDVPHAGALQTLRATNARLFPIWRTSYQDESATWGLQPLKDRVVGNVGSTLMLILAAVGCVLLIACANAINLLVARALGRSRELAVRAAVGASRGRLLQHVLVETGVLTVAAAAAGLAVAAGAIALVTRYGVGYIPRLDEVRLSGPVIGWLTVLAAASGLLIGLVPAIYGSRLSVDSTLRTGGRSASDGPAARRVRRALVAAEFALATPLVVAAVLVTASLDRLTRVPIGMDLDRMLTAGIPLPESSYSDGAARAAFWKRLLDRAAALPGVAAVAIADSRPPNDAADINNFTLEDRAMVAGQPEPVCPWVSVSPGFFKAAGLTLERGRLLDEHSLDDNVIVVDRAWANRFFPGEEVLGRRLRGGGCSTCPWTTVVGVVGTVKYLGMEAPDQGAVYTPFVDDPSGYLFLRASGDPAALTAGVRAVVREIDPGLPLTNVATGGELVSESLAQPRYLTVLVGMFALAALVLSVVGIYGVMAYFVQQHARDIGIRLALGGEPSNVRRMILLQALRLVAAGVACGMLAAFLTTRLMTTVLFGVSATDPRTMVAVPAALLTLAALASFVPARRAARLDPAQILRES